MRPDEHRYLLRNENIPIVYTRTETFRRSFFPGTIRDWNELDPSIRNADSINQFKSKLRNDTEVYNLYLNYGSRRINCILSSIRLHCSQLNSDLFNNNITSNKYCVCGNEETAYHFFFDCQNYMIMRNTLINETGFIAHLTTDLILTGDDTLSQRQTIMLHIAVSKYIIATNRFNI